MGIQKRRMVHVRRCAEFRHCMVSGFGDELADELEQGWNEIQDKLKKQS